MLKKQANLRSLFSIIRQRLKDDTIPCMNKGKTTGGFFSVPLILFSCIELLGILWQNPTEYADKKKKKGRKSYFASSHAQAAVSFMRKYLGKFRKEYKNYSGILYGLYRHNLAHNYQPGIIKINNIVRLTWEIEKDTKNSNHLKLRTETRQGKQYKILTINLDEFYQDVLNAIDALEKDALKHKTIHNKILRADKKLNALRPINSFGPYIQNDLNRI
jgi:hypothetical protein